MSSVSWRCGDLHFQLKAAFSDYDGSNEIINRFLNKETAVEARNAFNTMIQNQQGSALSFEERICAQWKYASTSIKIKWVGISVYLLIVLTLGVWMLIFVLRRTKRVKPQPIPMKNTSSEEAIEFIESTEATEASKQETAASAAPPPAQSNRLLLTLILCTVSCTICVVFLLFF